MIDEEDLESEEDLFRAVFREPLLHGSVGQREEAGRGRYCRQTHPVLLSGL